MTSLSKRPLCLTAAVFASAFVLLALGVAWAAVPPSIRTASQQAPPSSMFEEMSDEPVSRTAIDICWGGDGAAEVDTWTVRRAAGVAPPARDAVPVATLRGGRDWQCHRAKGLVLHAPYTFAITGRNEAGEGSEVGTITAASRESGLFVAGGRSRGRLPDSDEWGTVALAPAGSAGRVQVAYFRWPPGRALPGLYHSTATGARTWSRPQLVGKHPDDGTRPQIATNENGAVVVAWNGSFNSPKPAYRYLPAGTTQWEPVSRLSDGLGDVVEAATVDRTGGLHFLLRSGGQRGDVVYRTNATGGWTETRIPRTTCRTRDCEYFRPLMTYDPLVDRIVVVVQKREELRMAAKPAAAASFAGFDRLPGTEGRRLRATALTSHGQITVALVDVGRKAGLYLMSGGEPSGVGRLTKVPRTTLRDTQYERYLPYSGSFYVAAVNRDRVVLAWQRDYPAARSWDPQQQGIWVQSRKRDPSSGVWTFGPASHRTRSAYDGLQSLTIGPGERAYFAYSR